MQQDERQGATVQIARRDLMLATSALLAASAIPAQAQSAAAAGGDVPHADVPFNDGLAIPMPAKPSLGKGRIARWCSAAVANISQPGC